MPREQLGKMMEFEADRMTGLVLKDENVLPERDVVLEEYNMRVANNPEARLIEQIMAALYLNHPYGPPGDRLAPTKSRSSTAKMRSPSTSASYAPNNATLVIAGDVDAKDVHDLAEQAFGKVPAQASIPPRRIRPQEPEPIATRTVTFADPRVEQPKLLRYYLVPSATTAAAGESPALDVLAQLIGGGTNSYLYRALVVDHQLAVSTNAGYQGTSLDADAIVIAASPKPGVEFPQIEQAIDQVISTIAQNPVPAEDLERVKTQLIASAIYAQDSQATLARWYGAALTTGLSIEDIRSWPDRIRAVTGEQVREAAQKWLDKKRSVTGYLIKDTHTEARGEALVSHPWSYTRRTALLLGASLAVMPLLPTTVAGGNPDPAFRLARRHRSLVRAGFHRAAGLDGILLRRRARRRIRPTSPASPIWSPVCLMKAPAISIPKLFHERLDRRAIELSFSATRDNFRGSLRMLKDTKDEAFDLLRMSLTSPHFESSDVERIRSEVISDLQSETTSPQALAGRKFLAMAFGDHPYGRPASGTLDSVPKITIDDLKNYVRRVLAKDTLKVAVVGDVDPETLGKLLDKNVRQPAGEGGSDARCPISSPRSLRNAPSFRSTYRRPP